MVARHRLGPKGWGLVCLLSCIACGRGAPEPGPKAGESDPSAALGPLFGDRDFHRMGQPMPGDWLAEFEERGQTYAEWVRSQPNRPHARRRTIYIQPVGELGENAPDLTTLARYVEIFFGLPVRTLPTFSVAELDARRRTNRHTGRLQLRAGDILAWMKTWVPDDAYAVIALTAVDLYPDDDWNFVFGLGSFKERVGVYSLARYHPSFYGEAGTDVPGGDAQVLRRALKVMAHELGHIFGIHHCTHYECVMNGSNSLGETDRRPMHLCPLELRKLHDALGFDPAERYRRLSRFYAKHELRAEAAWTRRRAGP